MAVDQEGCPGCEPWIHGHRFLCIDLDQHETLPAGAIAIGFGLQLVQEGFFELENFFDVHAGDERLGGSSGSVGEQDIFKFVGAGGEDGSTLAHFRRIEQIEDRKMLYGKHLVHAFEAQTTLAVQKIGDVRLLEFGLLGEAQPG